MWQLYRLLRWVCVYKIRPGMMDVVRLLLIYIMSYQEVQQLSGSRKL